MEGTDTLDAALVADVADGDTGALRELYDRHAPWLHARLMRRCNDPEVVVDVLQDTFVALWKDAGKYRGEGEVAGWLWGIAFRRMVSRLRSRGPTLAGLLAIAVLAPVVTAGFLDFPIPFPVEGFPSGIRTFWVVVGGVAALACAAGCTHGRPHRRPRPGGSARLRRAPAQPGRADEALRRAGHDAA